MTNTTDRPSLQPFTFATSISNASCRHRARYDRIVGKDRSAANSEALRVQAYLRHDQVIRCAETGWPKPVTNYGDTSRCPN